MEEHLLLDRDEALAAIERLLAGAAGGRGGLLLLEGAPGMGKTALLRAACSRARAAGIRVCIGRCSELERGHGFGVVRQLFEPLAAGGAHRGQRLMNGPARLALPALETEPAPSISPTFAVFHGLYWLVADLTGAGPVLLAVDDAHWIDQPSVEWLAYLQQRLEDLPAAVVVASRSAPLESAFGRTVRLLSRTATLVRPGPLSIQSVTVLTRAALGIEPGSEFSTACQAATAGNPFVLTEVLRGLAAAGVAPTAAAAAKLDRKAPPAVARDLLLRLAPLGPSAGGVVRALAVLGAAAEVRLVATIAGLSPDLTSEIADQLAAAGILSPGRPLRFAHPLLRAAAEEDMPETARSRLHARAAEMLAAEDSDVEAVAAHLLAVQAAGADRVVARLRAAAAAALARGAPGPAAGYLRRALQEPPSAAVIPVVLGELGRSELVARHPGAAGHLADALSRTTDPIARALLIRDLADAYSYRGELRRAGTLLRQGLQELGDREPELALRLQTLILGVAVTDRPSPETAGGLDYLRRLGSTVTPAARALKLTLAMALALRAEETAEGVTALVREGLDEGRFLSDETSESISAAHAMSALIFVDQLDGACDVADAVLADARRRGSVLGLVAGMTHRGLAHLRAGLLAAAEADLTAARELVDERQMGFTLPFIGAYIATLLLEQGRVEEAAAVVDGWDLDRESAMAAAAMVFLQARAAVRAAEGRLAEAVADLSSSGEFCQAAAIRSPTALAWRSPLALLIAPQDGDEAQHLVRTELAEARRAGVARGVGVALRTLGVLTGGLEGLDLLRQAVEVLARSPARLEQSRAHLELGAMLARRGQRTAAREPLRIAGDLAYRCRADALTAQVRREALAAGARPRRPALTGVDALTPGELRVVTLAGKGIGNREIAQSLFISVKTVKDHLSSSYRKLGVTSRTELPSLEK